MQSKKSGSILNRPIKPSQRHVENLDIQYAKDKDAFDRRANIYRSKAGERCHHHRVSQASSHLHHIALLALAAQLSDATVAHHGPLPC